MEIVALDTCVILCYAMDEPRANKVADLLNKISRKEIQALIPATVLSEIVAILSKKKLQEIAFQIEEFLCKTGVEIVPVGRDMAVLAGVFKAKYSGGKKSFSYGDALVLAAAIQKDASVYTFDSEFSQVTEVPILGLSK